MRDFYRIVILITVVFSVHVAGKAIWEQYDSEGNEMDLYGPAVYTNITYQPDRSAIEDTIVTTEFSISSFDPKKLRDFCIYRFCEMCRVTMSDPDLKAIVFLSSGETSLEDFEIPGEDDESWDEDDDEDDDDWDDDDDEEEDEEAKLLARLPFSYYPLYESSKVKALLDSKQILLQAYSYYGLYDFTVVIKALIPIKGESATYLQVTKAYSFSPQVHYHQQGQGEKELSVLYSLFESLSPLLDDEGYFCQVFQYFHAALYKLHNFPITQVKFTRSNRPKTIDDLFKPIPG